MNKKTLFLGFFSLLVGLIFSLNNLIPMLVASRNSETIFTPFNGGDENLYAAQIREVFEGKFFSGDPFIYETKNLKPTLPWLGPLIFGLLAKCLGSLELVFIVSDFFLPAVIFFLIFKLTWQISRHYWGSILAGLSTLFLYQLTTKFPPVTTGLIKGFYQTLTLEIPLFFSFNRLIPPQFTFIVFLLFLISLYQTQIKKKNYWPIIAGLASGSLAYLYFYQWSASLVILTVITLLSFFSKDGFSKRLFIALTVSLFVSSGYFYQIFSFTQLDKQISFGRLDGRFLEPLTTLRYGLLAVFILIAPLKKPIKNLLLSIFISAVVLMNLQVFTGFTIAPGHWPHSTFEPLLVISGFILLTIVFKKYFPDTIKTGLLTIAVIIYAVVNQVKITQAWQSLYQLSSAENRLFQWLNQNTPSESVVLTLNKRLNRYLPVLTDNNIYLPYGSYSQLDNSQLWHRINLAFSAYHLNETQVKDYLLDTQFIGQLFDQTYNYHQRSDLSDLEFPDQIEDRILEANPVFTFGVRYIPDNLKQRNLDQVTGLIQTPLISRLCHYQLDYLIITPSELDLIPQLSEVKILQLVFEAGEYQVYQLDTSICPKI